MTVNGTANDFVVKIITPLLVAAVIGIYSFSSSRAGNDDLARVEKKLEDTETRIQVAFEKLEDTVDAIEDAQHASEIEQAEFRAQVRAALEIVDGD